MKLAAESLTKDYERKYQSRHGCGHSRPIVAPRLSSIDEMLRYMSKALARRREVGTGQEVLFVAGDEPGTPGATNTLKIHRIAASAPQ